MGVLGMVVHKYIAPLVAGTCMAASAAASGPVLMVGLAIAGAAAGLVSLPAGERLIERLPLG